ncbi:MAG: 3'-5' exonuclease [Planctomycetota bacterium]|nr:3'-5' exonuclease [Planctomycetota bacterium]
MAEPSRGILDHAVAATPLAVLDFETTGLHAGGDRVVEVSVARVEPGGEPRLVLDTLIDPQRPVAATFIHGIRDDDVIDAPTFREIAGALIDALDGCVLAAYNAYFDMRFLDWEMRAAGVAERPPYLCLMYLRSLLGLGRRCSLDEACRVHRIEWSRAHASTAHTAAADALAAAGLWARYLPAMVDREIRTFGDLAAQRRYKFTESFIRPPLRAPALWPSADRPRLKPRGRAWAMPVDA